MTLILMDAWCSEELTAKPNETTAMLGMMVAKKNTGEKITFSRHGDGFYS